MDGVGIGRIPLRKTIREVEAVVVPCDEVVPTPERPPPEASLPPLDEIPAEAPIAARRTEPPDDGESAVEDTWPADEEVVPQIEAERLPDAGVEADGELEPVVDMTSCSIAVWRGYRKAMFYAQTFDSNGDAVALAESPMFKYSGNGVPDQTDAAVQAYEALVELLTEEGWQTVDQGPAWFDQTLTQA
jgi:hypothetical protein